METDPTATTGARRLREGFERAMEIAPELRAGWIRDHIADPDLRNRLLRLCAAAESVGALDQPAAQRIERLAVDAERPAAELLGQSFAGFRLVRVIGRGGMATVSSARAPTSSSSPRSSCCAAGCTRNWSSACSSASAGCWHSCRIRTSRA